MGFPTCLWLSPLDEIFMIQSPIYPWVEDLCQVPPCHDEAGTHVIRWGRILFTRTWHHWSFTMGPTMFSNRIRLQNHTFSPNDDYPKNLCWSLLIRTFCPVESHEFVEIPRNTIWKPLYKIHEIHMLYKALWQMYNSLSAYLRGKRTRHYWMKITWCNIFIWNPMSALKVTCFVKHFLQLKLLDGFNK